MQNGRLLDVWRAWKPSSPPHVLAGDREAAFSHRRGVVSWASWEQAVAEPDFCASDDSRLHLALVPQPFIGDVLNARVYVLALNPGLGPTDYFGENKVPGYRQALLDNLGQTFPSDRLPFLFLDRQFSWHGGFGWWYGKLAKTIAALAEARDISIPDALRFLGSTLASIELVPYHSRVFGVGPNIMNGFESVRLVRGFVREYVLPRVRRGDAIVIVTRGRRVWDAPVMERVVIYSSAEAQSAHLSPQSPGGRALLDFLT